MWCGTWAPAACRLQHQNQASWLFAHPIAPQKDTPQPTDAHVRVVEYESITVFVRVFSGFATEGAKIGFGCGGSIGRNASMQYSRNQASTACAWEPACPL